MSHASPFNRSRRFSDESLTQIAMPMGGIGAGCICLSGHGALIDFSIRHRPATTALPDRFAIGDGAFALLHIKGDTPITRLLEGPLPAGKVYDQNLQANGYRHGQYEGFPRFRGATFAAAYPFGQIDLEHPGVPLQVSLTGFSPFIPRDDINSGIPAAIVEYQFTNPTAKPIAFDFSFHMIHPAVGTAGWKSTRNRCIDGFGVAFSNTDRAESPLSATATIGVVGHDPQIQAMWFRGGWWDAFSAAWNDASSGTFRENNGEAHPNIEGINGGSVRVSKTLGPGQSVTIPVVVSWHVPNVDYAYGGVDTPPGPGDNIPPPAKDQGEPPKWRPFYATVWKDATAVARHVLDNYGSLRSRTVAFRAALESSTVPDVVLDAVSCNLAILKSPTVLRTESGSLWAWEGCFTTHGSCHGSCTHVWNYAQAFPHLFPKLERTFREAEYLRSMDERGHVQFRSALPDGPTPHDFHPAADGQLGGLMKLYRDWQISGDYAWFKSLYPKAIKSLEFCIRSWDPQEIGLLVEPHHNTYDIEFWGPDGMCSTVYIGALCAAAMLAESVGDHSQAQRYESLAKSGAARIAGELFNGEYLQQNVRWLDLRDQSIVKALEQPDDPNPQLTDLLRREGPKYQYGTGCISDGVIGAWMARLYGIETPLDLQQIRSHLKSIMKYNFRSDLWDHVCTQRPGYAIGGEGGLVLCTWPRGGRPMLPFVYSDEVWTGIEYQVASHLIEEGMVDDAWKIVRTVRDRYEGRVRNPFNEYECGSYYARALASFALLLSYSGFRYSAVTKKLQINPKTDVRPFTCFFSAANAFGTVTLDDEMLSVDCVEGSLDIAEAIVNGRVCQRSKGADSAARFSLE